MNKSKELIARLRSMGYEVRVNKFVVTASLITNEGRTFHTSVSEMELEVANFDIVADMVRRINDAIVNQL